MYTQGGRSSWERRQTGAGKDAGGPRDTVLRMNVPAPS